MDWASQAHHHSILGVSFHYGSGAISWSLKKQNIVALSSTESEYVALTHAGKEAIWLKTFVSKIASQEIGPLTIVGDNQGSLDLAKDNKFHSRTKHINLAEVETCITIDLAVTYLTLVSLGMSITILPLLIALKDCLLAAKNSLGGILVKLLKFS